MSNRLPIVLVLLFIAARIHHHQAAAIDHRATDHAPAGSSAPPDPPSNAAADPGLFGYPEGTVLENGPIRYALDGLTGTARWTMHTISVDSLRGDAKRRDNFHPDPRIPAEWRATDKDYRGQPYQRGHLVPSKDFGNQADRDATFAFSNMVPEAQDFNEFFLGKRLEPAVRAMAQPGLMLYVATVTIHVDQADVENRNIVIKTIGPHRLAVPKAIAKAVLVARDTEAMGTRGWLAPNQPITHDTEEEAFRVPVVTIEKLARLNLFPKLEKDVADRLESQP